MDFQPGRYLFAEKKTKKETECFKHADLKKLQDRLKESDNIRDLALLLELFTGLRVGELTGLKAVDNIS